MNVLFFIGNGFDLNIGMHTSYGDFYKYYQQVDSQSDAITRLKKEIAKNIKYWSDLELALGQYLENIKTVSEFDEVFEDIGEKLSEYLLKEEEKFDFSKIDRKRLFDNLAFPEDILLRADTNKIALFRRTWKGETWNVQIITFNYTTTLEKIVGDKQNNLQIGTHHNRNILLEGIVHIHGYANDRMVMGVNDVSQIKNNSFKQNIDVLEAIVKSTCNQAYRHTIDNHCKQLVSKANLICIFGSSIGDTDIIWWELIGEQLKRDCLLVIFAKSEEISPRIAYKKARLERHIKESFLKKIKFNAENKVTIADKIYIGLNTNIFNLRK